MKWDIGSNGKINREPVKIPIEVKSTLVRETAIGHELKTYIGTDNQVKNSSICGKEMVGSCMYAMNALRKK